MENVCNWWEEEGLRFECLQCGRCCGGEPGSIWITSQELIKIAGHLGIDEAVLRKEYLTRDMGRTSIKELDNYDCIFLDNDSKRCKIYEVRPLQCSLFPFWPSLLSDKNIWNFYATICPGMNKGKLYTKEMIYKFQNIKIWDDL